MRAWIARLVVLVLVPMLFVGGVEAFPQLVDKEQLRWFAALFGIVGTAIAWMFRALLAATRMEGLIARERERLQYAAANIRRRLWWMSGVCTLAALALLVVSIARASFEASQVALMAGVLIGIGSSYLALVPFWYEELHDFVAAVRERAQQRRDLDHALKDLPESA